MKDNLQSSLLVAMDLGSHSFRAMAAERMPDGLIRVLGAEESSNRFCVNRGVIENTTDAGFMINQILKFLGNRIRVSNIHNAFVCVGGRMMKVVPVFSSRDQVRRRDITQNLLDEMEMECKEKIEKKNADVHVLDLVPYYYKLDGKEQDHTPTQDQKAAIVEVHYIAFVGKKEYEKRIEGSFERSTIHIEHAYARPDALLNALTSDQDVLQGCAILDLGAQTTTLSLYKGTQYLHAQVIAQGGLDITEAISEEFGISLMYAEHLKCKYGVALPGLVEANKRYVVRGENGQQVAITTQELTTLISKKLENILAPLIDVVNKEANRYNILYVTGGGAMLQGIVEYIQLYTRINVAYGSHAGWLTADTSEEYCMPRYSSLIGTLLLGSEYREKHPLKPYRKDKRIIDVLRDKTLEIFTPEEFNISPDTEGDSSHSNQDKK
jgi:cell division protein FtsA